MPNSSYDEHTPLLAAIGSSRRAREIEQENQDESEALKNEARATSSFLCAGTVDWFKSRMKSSLLIFLSLFIVGIAHLLAVCRVTDSVGRSIFTIQEGMDVIGLGSNAVAINTFIFFGCLSTGVITALTRYKKVVNWVTDVSHQLLWFLPKDEVDLSSLSEQKQAQIKKQEQLQEAYNALSTEKFLIKGFAIANKKHLVMIAMAFIWISGFFAGLSALQSGDSLGEFLVRWALSLPIGPLSQAWVQGIEAFAWLNALSGIISFGAFFGAIAKEAVVRLLTLDLWSKFNNKFFKAFFSAVVVFGVIGNTMFGYLSSVKGLMTLGLYLGFYIPKKVADGISYASCVPGGVSTFVSRFAPLVDRTLSKDPETKTNDQGLSPRAVFQDGFKCKYEKKLTDDAVYIKIKKNIKNMALFAFVASMPFIFTTDLILMLITFFVSAYEFFADPFNLPASLPELWHQSPAELIGVALWLLLFTLAAEALYYVANTLPAALAAAEIRGEVLNVRLKDLEVSDPESTPLLMGNSVSQTGVFSRTANHLIEENVPRTGCWRLCGA